MDIHYIATKEKVVDELKRYAEQAGYKLVSLDLEKPLADLQYLIIVEPLSMRQDYYSVNGLWKHWLLRHKPAAKLVVAAFATKTAHRNFLSLLHLPDSLGKFLQDAAPVADYSPIYRETKEHEEIKTDYYADPWPLLLPLTGIPTQPLMTQFLNGHDRANSFFEQLVRLRKGLMDIEDVSYRKQFKLPAAHEDDLGKLRKNIVQEFDKLNNRWGYYRPLMEYLPFGEEIWQIEQYLADLDKGVRADEWPAEAAQTQRASVEKIRDILKDKLFPIIHPEEYW